jgi:hypothetical protein
MSRKAEFLANAEKAAALAEHCADQLSRETLQQAARAWRLLADLEGADWIVPERAPDRARPAS